MTDRTARTDAGSPYVWSHAETSGPYTVLRDHSYGLLALFQGDELLAVGKDHIFPSAWTSDPVSIVVLDRDYYGVHKYIWT